LLLITLEYFAPKSDYSDSIQCGPKSYLIETFEYPTFGDETNKQTNKQTDMQEGRWAGRAEVTVVLPYPLRVKKTTK
jgi:hypothetical protein